MIVYISDPKNSSKELLQLKKKLLVMYQDTRLTQKKSEALIFTDNSRLGKDIRETSPFTIATNSKKKISK